MTMDHKAMKEKLFAYYDEQLEAPVRHQVEVHLSDCPECRRTLARWKKTSRVFFQKPSVAPSEFFVRQVMTKIKDSASVSEIVRPRVVWPWLVPAIGAAAILMLVLRPVLIPDPSLSMDGFLINTQEFGSSVLSGQTPTTDEMFEYVMGG